MSVLQKAISPDEGLPTATSLSLSFASPVSSGDTVAGYFTYSNDGTVSVSKIQDDQGNNYGVVDSVTDTTAGQTFASYELGNITNGPKTITISWNKLTNFFRNEMVDLSGVGALDKHAMQLQTSPGTGSGAVTSGSVTTTAADFGYSGCFDVNGNTSSITPTASWTEENNGSGAGLNVPMVDAVQQQSAAGSIAGTFTINANSSMATGVMCFLPASVTLTGVAATVAAGSLAANPEAVPAGASASGAVGGQTLKGAMLAVSATAAAGMITPQVQVAETGVSVSGAAAALTPSIAAPPSGAAATASAGSITPMFSLTSPAATATAGVAQLMPSPEPTPACASATGATSGTKPSIGAVPLAASTAGQAGSLGGVNAGGAAATASAGALGITSQTAFAAASATGAAGATTGVVAEPIAGVSASAQAAGSVGDPSAQPAGVASTASAAALGIASRIVLGPAIAVAGVGSFAMSTAPPTWNPKRTLSAPAVVRLLSAPPVIRSLGPLRPPTRIL